MLGQGKALEDGQWADWPDSVGMDTEDRWAINVNSKSYNLLEVDLGQPKLEKNNTVIVIPLLSESDGEVTKIRIKLVSDGYQYLPSNNQATISIGTKSWKLNEYLDNDCLRLLQTDGSIIFGNICYYNESGYNVKIPKHLISIWDWKTTNINRESMGKAADLETVQGFAFQQILDNYEIIFNDDGSGEIADLVAIRESVGNIQVDLYHCKYCGSGVLGISPAHELMMFMPYLGKQINPPSGCIAGRSYLKDYSTDMAKTVISVYLKVQCH